MRQESYVSAENIHRKTAEWIEAVYSRVSRRDDLVLKPGNCALLVIDMLRYFANPEGRSYLSSTEAVIPKIGQLLRLWREMNGIVVFTRHCHTGTHDLGMLGKFFSDYIRCGRPEAEIIPDLAPINGEKVIRKCTYDAFHLTDLDEFLRSRGISQVLITGVLTQLCCETSARSAFVRGFEVFVAADALTTSTEEMHVASLLNLASGFAVITDTASICRIAE